MLCDYNLARSFDEEGDHDGMAPCAGYTGAVVTNGYRAPELLLYEDHPQTKYGTPVDVFSLGCTFAEMLQLLGNSCGAASHIVPKEMQLYPCCHVLPPFGANQTLTSITEVLGRQPAQKVREGGPQDRRQYATWLEKLGNAAGLLVEGDRGGAGGAAAAPQASFTDITRFKNKFPLIWSACTKAEVAGELPQLDCALDLLTKMVEFSDAQRWTVDACLDHPFFDGVRNPDEVAAATHPNGAIHFGSFDDPRRSIVELLRKCSSQKGAIPENWEEWEAKGRPGYRPGGGGAAGGGGGGAAAGGGGGGGP